MKVQPKSTSSEESDLAVAIATTDHAQGPETAPVTLVEYGDYECPTCGQAFPIVKRLRQTLSDQLRLIFRHFPLSNIHPHASVAAQAAEAAGAQKKFWPMHDMLFEHQTEFDVVDFSQLALRAGVELYQYEADMSSQRFAGKVLRDYEGGVISGVKKTPTLFINGKKYNGLLEYEALLAAIQSA